MLFRSVKFSRPGADRVLELNILSNLVACHIELKEISDAVLVSIRILSEYQDLAFAGPTNQVLCNTASAFALEKRWSLADQCLLGARMIAQEGKLTAAHALVAQAEATIAMARGNYAVAAAHAEAILDNFADNLSSEARSQIYSLLITSYQQLSRPDDMLALRKRRLTLSESRYGAGLAAAMVILDLKASLRQLPK